MLASSSSRSKLYLRWGNGSSEGVSDSGRDNPFNLRMLVA